MEQPAQDPGSILSSPIEYNDDLNKKKKLIDYCHSIFTIYYNKTIWNDEQSAMIHDLHEYERIFKETPLDSEEANYLTNTDQYVQHQWFYTVLFMLTQFNVHYLSWIKNPIYHHDYVERVLVFLRYITPLCRLDPSWRNMFENEQEFCQYLLYKSIQNSFEYEREINVKLYDLKSDDTMSFFLDNTIANSDAKKFLIYVNYDEHDKEKMKMKISDSESSEEITEKFSNGIYLGQMNIESNAICKLKLPRSENYSNKEVNLQFILVDVEGEPKKLATIHIAEGTISGYYGCRQSFTFQFEKQLPTSMLKEETYLKFSLLIQWSVNGNSYSDINEECSLHLLHYISASLLHFGTYYWHFFRPFFFAKLKEYSSKQSFCIKNFSTVRTIITNLFLVIDDADDLTNLFNLVYRDCGFILNDELFGALDLYHLVMIFPRLSDDQQLFYIENFAEFMIRNSKLLIDEAKIITRLIYLIRHHAGNYDSDSLQRTIVPLSTFLLHSIASTNSWKIIVENGYQQQDPVDNVEYITKMVHVIINLFIQCIDYMKPLNWCSLPINDPDMLPILNALENCIKLLQNSDDDKGSMLTLLYIIYIRIRRQQVLHKEHLLPFLTKDRIKRFLQLVDQRSNLM